MIRQNLETWQVIEGFAAKMAEHGLNPGHVNPDGKIHRFSPTGKGDRDAWYVLYDTGGAFGNWATDLKETYCPLNGSTPPEVRRELQRQMRQQIEEREREEQATHESVAVASLARWDKASREGNSGYLELKNISGLGVRFEGDIILVPLYDTAGKLWNLQTIAPDGTKRFQKGGRKKGLFCPLGDLQNNAVVYVCEGYATGVSLHMATNKPVVVAFDAYNLEPVLETLIKKVSAAQFTIAADDDRWKPLAGNVGRERAKEAAQRFKCRYITPIFRDDYTKPTDFNDLHVLEGLEHLTKQLADKAPDSIVTRVNIANWGKPLPPREWIVPDWIPHRYVTALYGDGGVGKSLLALQLATAVVTGNQWLNMDTRQGRVYCLFCEDSEEDLNRRQQDINRFYGLHMGQVANDMAIVPRLGRDNYLMTYKGFDETPHYTDFFRSLYSDIRDFKPTLVILDTAADLFGGNENNRTQVRNFVQSGLGRIARDANCAVLLCAHPSAAGLASKSGVGGSTAWNNTLRSRLYLTRPKEVQEEDGEASDMRTLKRMKSNYARAGVSLDVMYDDGAFKIPTPQYMDTVDRIDFNNKCRRFMDVLDQLIDDGYYPSDSYKSTHYAPKHIALRTGETVEKCESY
ncbi:MAG: AAA family ATPase, partial [Leptolyngbyaceae bacterium]|nr:AAA family ATPase [Leptolyngbyaceae bacterium]